MSDTEQLVHTDIQNIHKQVVDVYNYVYIFAFISRIAIQKYVLTGDNAGRGIFAMSILALLFNIFAIKNFFFSKNRPACMFWVLLTFFSFVNSMIMGVPPTKDGVIIFIRNNFTEPLVFLMVTTCMLRRHRTETLLVILWSLLFYVMIGTVKIDTGTSRLGRYMNHEMGNFLPLFSVSLVLVAAVLRQEKTIKWLFVPILFLACISVFLCATRKAFAAIFIILLAYFLCKKTKRSVWKLVMMAVAFVVMFVGLNYVMDNTMLGQRFGSTFKSPIPEEVYPLASNPALNKLLNGLVGDRSVMYYKGVRLFAEHPINGVGLLNYCARTGETVQIHSEYIVQLCENGIIGFGLLCAFIASVIHCLINVKVKTSSHKIVAGGFLAILVINFTAWTYCADYAMIVYALVFTTIYPKKKKVFAVQIENEENSDSRQSGVVQQVLD